MYFSFFLVWFLSGGHAGLSRMRVCVLTPFASFYVEIVQDQRNRVNTFFTIYSNFLINSLFYLHSATNSLEYIKVIIFYKETAMHSRYEIIEAALQKKRFSRVPCFPRIDIAFAAAYLGKPLREVQRNPGVHAAALGRCAGDLPVDGVYINLGLASFPDKLDGFILSTGCLVPRDATVELFEIVSDMCAWHKLT